MAERLKAAVSKTAKGLNHPSWVRIPLSPPKAQRKLRFLAEESGIRRKTFKSVYSAAGKNGGHLLNLKTTSLNVGALLMAGALCSASAQAAAKKSEKKPNPAAAKKVPAKKVAAKKPVKAAKKPVKVEEPKPPTLSRLKNLPSNLHLSALLDVRYVHTDSNQGPAGAQVPSYPKTRYTGNGTKGQSRFRLSQLSMNLTWDMTPHWKFYSQFLANVESKKNRLTSENFGSGGTVGMTYGLFEGADVIGKNTLLRVGTVNAPFTNEYLGANFEPLYSITPAATCSLLTTLSPGLEFEWHTQNKPANVSVSLGAFSVMDDVPYLATDPVNFTPAAWAFDDTVTDYRTTHDVDGRLGHYLVGTVTEKNEKWQVNAGILDNGNDGLMGDNGAGLQGYDTNLWSAALKAQPVKGLTGVLQYLSGDSKWCEGATCATAPDNRSSADYNAGSFLVSYKPKKTRYTVRYDWFETDMKGTPHGFVGSEEEGNAWTLAWRRDLKKNRDFTAEYLKVTNDPAFGAGLKVWDAPDNLLQVSFRQFF